MKVDFSKTGKVEYERKTRTDLKAKYQSEAEVVKKSNSDILEISEESRKLSIVSSRLQNGFYNNPEVMKELAERINQEV